MTNTTNNAPDERDEAGKNAAPSSSVSASPLAAGMNAVAGAMDALRTAAGELVDPVKRVCYPPLSALNDVATEHALRVCDPIQRVCYEPLKGHWEHKYKARYPKHAGKLVALDLALVTIIAALIVAGIYVPPLLPKGDVAAVTAAIRADGPATGGMPLRADIAYENLSAVTVRCAILAVQVPPAFADATLALHNADGDDAAPDASCGELGAPTGMLATFLPALPAGGKGSAMLTGVPYAPTGTVVEIPATVSYWETARTEPTVVPLRLHLPITSSVVSVGVDVSERILRGAATAITLTYRNDSDRLLPGAAVRFVPPADFVMTGGLPRTTAPNLWRIGDLEPGASGTVTAYGYLRSVQARTSAASFGAQLLMENADATVTVAAARDNADALATGLTIEQTFGAGSAAPGFLRAGETVTVRLVAENRGEREVTNGVLALDVPSVLLEAPGVRTMWTAAELPELARIAPGERVEAEAVLTIRRVLTPEVLDALGGGATATFASSLTAFADGERVIIDTPPTDIPLVTELRLQAAAIYYTRGGDQLGRGPLPPTVGETTSYRVIVQLDNLHGALEDALFEAYLPDGVAWTGRASVTHGEAVDHFPLARRVTWRVPRMEPFTEETGRSPGASFEVSITPSADEVGTMPVLLRGLVVSGRDAATGVRVTARVGDVSTRLPFDFDDAQSVVVR